MTTSTVVGTRAAQGSGATAREGNVAGSELPGVTRRRPTLNGAGPVFLDLRRQVETHLEAHPELMQRALLCLRLKTATGAVVLAISWYHISFGHPGRVGAALSMVGLFAGVVTLAVNVLHDAGHGATFQGRRANLVVGWLADALLGFDTYAWRFKHNVTHHTYPNVDGLDDDIAQAPILRIAPTQSRRQWHRYQQYYNWPAYGLSVLRWHLTDIINLWRTTMGAYEYPRAQGWSRLASITGKVFFWTFSVVIPWLAGGNSLSGVLLTYLAVVVSVSAVLVTVFQLAHVVEAADFLTRTELRERPLEWAELQLASTVDFSRDNRLLAAILGGLNLQVEHHLFPRLPHTVYPHLRAPIDQALRAHGLQVKTHAGFLDALRAHSRYLRAMGIAGERVEIEMG